MFSVFHRMSSSSSSSSRRRRRHKNTPPNVGHADGLHYVCTPALLTWLAELYSEDTLDVAARDLVQAVLHDQGTDASNDKVRSMLFRVRFFLFVRSRLDYRHL